MSKRLGHGHAVWPWLRVFSRGKLDFPAENLILPMGNNFSDVFFFYFGDLSLV